MRKHEKVWFFSDPHFGHSNILKFQDHQGNLIRPGFDDTDHMDEHIIEKFNDTIALYDKVYFLGDITFSVKKLMEIMPRLHGKKRLVLGNHDNFDITVYRKYFKKIFSWRGFHDEESGVKFVATHAPLHPDSFSYRCHGNLHGHTHQNLVKDPVTKHIDKRYMNVCVEQTDYYPVNFYDVVNYFKGSMK